MKDEFVIHLWNDTELQITSSVSKKQAIIGRRNGTERRVSN